jgi:hypothetical protein
MLVASVKVPMIESKSLTSIINSTDFKIADGVMQLQTLAALPSIATAIPVTFALTLKKQ